MACPARKVRLKNGSCGTLLVIRGNISRKMKVHEGHRETMHGGRKNRETRGEMSATNNGRNTVHNATSLHQPVAYSNMPGAPE